ncbi:MAG: dihydropteroate synthase [Elusimicrobiota bacterium]
MKIEDLFYKSPSIMGVLNITPDSFYDGGKYNDPEKAFQRALKLNEDGADIIDIGGESTRPGSKSISAGEEMSRVLPVIEKLKDSFPDIKISCDTTSPKVAREVLERGVDMINNVAGFRNPKMRKTVAEYNPAICIMHMQGNPENMQDSPQYKDLLTDIRNFLHKNADKCLEEGVDKDNILIDPGIGFGKTLKHNLKIIANIDKLSDEYPVLLGASRKSFLKDLLDLPPNQRLSGSLAVSCWSAFLDISVLRVHDVKETKQALEVVKALNRERI